MRCRVTLRAMSASLSPGSLSAQLDLEPTEVVLAGTPKSSRNPGGPRHAEHVWLQDRDGASLEETLLGWLTLLEPRRSALAQCGAVATIDLVIGIFDDQADRHVVSGRVLQRLAALGLPVVLDLYSPPSSLRRAPPLEQIAAQLTAGTAAMVIEVASVDGQLSFTLSAARLAQLGAALSTLTLSVL